jgi:hypothetical protein
MPLTAPYAAQAASAAGVSAGNSTDVSAGAVYQGIGEERVDCHIESRIQFDDLDFVLGTTIQLLIHAVLTSFPLHG